ncbi:hypothetical protein K505DRAFT_365344 [Melanomma pulvis-pyrius CBS 109.77]|uniref:F-box domain-containing protein n=1 Tax=Melanomma pulvis-pyrius CBS 109.77 TaxID=1314802 RepID=A0A6A6X1E3_9PLEO|nr:hypothetical protein K505DRAFT_365344 [Melanomma pulvis-pyrius CBS 109.77]
MRNWQVRMMPIGRSCTTSGTVSLSTLPSELLLKIFRSLIPSNAHDNSEKVDLQSIRSTCKALNSAATELFFESWPILLWERDNSFEPTKSFSLLREHPSLAALVKSVTIKTAACSDKYILRLIKAEFVWETLNTDSNQGFIKGPSDEKIMSELIRRFSVLPNIQRVALRTPSLSDGQFYNKFLACIHARGKKVKKSTLALRITDRRIHTRCFPFHFQSITATLRALPPKVKSATLEIDLESFPRVIDIPAFFSQNARLRTQLDSLSLVIEEKRIPPECASSTWCDMINRFESLTQLAIHVSGPPLTATTARYQREKSIVTRLLVWFHLPNVRRLTLSQSVICVSDFRNLRTAFPNLEVLEVENVAIMSPNEDSIPLGRTTWLEVAQHIDREYKGRCILSFGSGPILEIDGKLDNDHFGYSVAPNSAITRTLKTPALEILTAISNSKRPEYTDSCTNGDARAPDFELEQQYTRMTEHTPPNVTINSVHAMTAPYWKDVDTKGMEFRYYGFLRQNRPVYPDRGGPPPGVHPLDWG